VKLQNLGKLEECRTSIRLKDLQCVLSTSNILVVIKALEASCIALITSQTSFSNFCTTMPSAFYNLPLFLPAPPLVSPNFLTNFPHTTSP
jgi:hypothetical protein